MRIIDTDILLKNLEWLDEYDSYVLHSVKIAMDKTPTVKAIPIEWIEKWVECEYNKQHLGTAKTHVWEMLEDWEKENETNVEC